MNITDIMELFESEKFINDHEEEYINMSRGTFGATIGMMAEKYCKAHNHNVVEFFKDMVDVATAVNDLLGEY